MWHFFFWCQDTCDNDTQYNDNWYNTQHNNNQYGDIQHYYSNQNYALYKDAEFSFSPKFVVLYRSVSGWPENWEKITQMLEKVAKKIAKSKIAKSKIAKSKIAKSKIAKSKIAKSKKPEYLHQSST